MRMWEIREKARHDDDHYDDYRGRTSYRMGMRDKSVEEAYECGFEDGYEAAMKEIEHSERSDYSDGHKYDTSLRRYRR